MTREETIKALGLMEHVESIVVTYEPGEIRDDTTVRELKEACRSAIAALRAQQEAMKLDRICRAALEKWGEGPQVAMVFEEMAELQKELCKNMRGADNVDHIAEEIADVQIMLEQMMILRDCRELAEAWKSKKLDRLGRRIGGNDG